jgi:TetR/AcrR family transcriptional regulator, mexJK operon transcriptional repressor
MGRPKKLDPSTGQPTKQQCILKAAQEVFLELGYAAASMDAVAARANVSKATIYAHFDNKRSLFQAVIGRRCATAMALAIPETFTDARQALFYLARHILERSLSPDALAIHRVVLSEAPRLPEVGEAYYEAGPAMALHLVGRLFGDLAGSGLLQLPAKEAPLAADLFLSMLKCDIHTRALVGLPPSQGNLDDIASAAVELVMARYGATAGSTQPATKRALNR